LAPPRLTIDREAVKAAAVEVAATEQIPSRSKVASRLGLVESTLNKRLREEGWTETIDAILKREAHMEPSISPGVKEGKDGTLTFASEPIPPSSPWKPEAVMRAHGADPDEYVIVRVRFNRWGAPDSPSAQLRFDAIPKASLFQFPEPTDWTPPPKPKKRRLKKGEARVNIVIGDHHAPHQDRTFHSLFLEYLAELQPDEIDVNGDLFDFATISRHREREGYAQGVNEGLREGYGILRDYRHTCPDARILLKRGNHCERLLYMILDNARELHKIAPADEELPALDLRRLLHLDDLHVEYVDEEWDRAKTTPSRKLSVRHGYTASKNSTEQMLSKLAGSTIQNHTHRLSLRFRTEHTGNSDEPTVTRMGGEAGCACEIADGLGYYVGGEPDWQNGALLNYIWPDSGDFLTQPIVYVPGRLLAPGGRRYEV
jgi:hypothetical protein